LGVSIQVRWITAFLDLPREHYAADTEFWCALTGSTRSTLRGPDGEFATLIPPDGDAYLRVQRVKDGPGGVHIDLHVTDVVASGLEAERLGAELIADYGYRICRSPAGFVFCLVPHHGEHQRPRPHGIGDGESAAVRLVDQVAIDIPQDRYEDECAFWSALTGWELRAASREEFSVLVRPEAMPIRLLLHRLGTNDTRSIATGHLDIASGNAVIDFAAVDQAAGASVAYHGTHWISMRDPAGVSYCLTQRNPETGVL
jgi:hypothetical protein